MMQESDDSKADRRQQSFGTGDRPVAGEGGALYRHTTAGGGNAADPPQEDSPAPLTVDLKVQKRSHDSLAINDWEPGAPQEDAPLPSLDAVADGLETFNVGFRRVPAAYVEAIRRHAAALAEKDAAIAAALKHADANGMQDWPVFKKLRRALGSEKGSTHADD